MFSKIRRAATAVPLLATALFAASPAIASIESNYTSCNTNLNQMANAWFYEYRNYGHMNGALGQTTIRNVHSCATNYGVTGSSLVPVTNLQGSGYQVQLGYGTIAQGANDFLVTIADNSNPRGMMAYVKNLIGHDPITFTPGHFTLFEIDFEPNSINPDLFNGTWHFTITDRVTSVSGSFTQAAHIKDVDDSGATTWWSPGEVHNLRDQFGGPDSTNVSAITQMKWRYTYTGAWVTAQDNFNTTICSYLDQYGGTQFCTFPTSYYIKGSNTDADGNERITGYTTDVPVP